MFESDKVATWKAVYFAFINMSAKAKNLMEQTLELNEAENLLQEVRNYFVIREHEATKHITNLRTMDSIMDLLKKILALKTDHYKEQANIPIFELIEIFQLYGVLYLGMVFLLISIAIRLLSKYFIRCKAICAHDFDGLWFFSQ